MAYAKENLYNRKQEIKGKLYIAVRKRKVEENRDESAEFSVGGRPDNWANVKS